MFDSLKQEVAEKLAAAADMPVDDVLPSIELGKMGDLSSKIAFVLAKERKANPVQIASEISRKLESGTNFDRVEATGPYINFYLSDRAFSAVLSDILAKKERYGSGKSRKSKVVVEFPAVNPNKPWHIGHLRNALLGDSVARILEFDGYSVERMDYINDLGLQVAQSLWGVLNYDSDPSGKFDRWLGEQYVGIAKRFELDKDVVNGVRDLIKDMESGDNEIADVGRKLAEQCVKAQYETSFALDIYHDVLIFESDIMQSIFDEGIEYLKESDCVFHEKEGKNTGCWVVRFSAEEFGKMENPDKILIRSDGTAVYTGKDVIFHLWKFGKLKGKFKYKPFIRQPNGKVAYMSSSDGKSMAFGNADIAVNVIGVEQKYPQRVVADILKKFGGDSEPKLLHLSYEHVGLPDQKFSGRKGTWVGYTVDDFISEAQEKVKEYIKLDFSESEKKEISQVVGIGAIKFSFLKPSSDKRMTFRWEEALNFEGDSGPYAQYAYVRTKSILEKAKEDPKVSGQTILNDSEKSLIKRLGQFPDAVSRCSKELAPHHLSQYVLDVAADFSSFYAKSPVLSAEDEKTRRTRLAITLATGIVIKNALYLLGINCPERM